jgi:uncharacterized protein (TIGR03382 family)
MGGLFAAVRLPQPARAANPAFPNGPDEDVVAVNLVKEKKREDGCSAGGSLSGSFVAAFAMLALLALRRRRTACSAG